MFYFLLSVSPAAPQGQKSFVFFFIHVFLVQRTEPGTQEALSKYLLNK